MKKILVVDDEALILYSLASVLQGAHTEVKTVTNGKDALGEINSHSYDVCLLDIRLPDMCGLDIMKTVKKTSPATKVIIMTGCEVDDDAMKSIRENAHLFLTKPFDLFWVKSIVNRIAEGKEDVYKDYESLVNWLTERRQHQRRTATETITYATSTLDDKEIGNIHKAEMIDLCDSGMCFRTDYQLEPGRMIRIGNGPEGYAGVVRWSQILIDKSHFCVGIQFL